MPHRTPSTHALSLKDEAIIATLAQETDSNEAVVKLLYEEEIAILRSQASVKNFIDVIAARRVRQRLAAAPGHGGRNAVARRESRAA